jgi:hypothetical protein
MRRRRPELDYCAVKKNIISNLEGMCKEVVSAYIEVLFHHFVERIITTSMNPVN